MGDNIREDLKETVRNYGLEASGSGQGPELGSCEMVMNLRDP